MPERFPAQTTRWIIQGTQWMPAQSEVDVAHYTNATTFLDNGQVIDGRKNGLTEQQFEDLKARYPDDVIELRDGSFALPFVPIGTIVDISPETGSTKSPNK
jgi:hypothetical protein